MRSYALGLMAVLMAAGGCGGSGMTLGRMGLNLARKDSYLKISLDGHEAQQNKLKKAASGYSSWKISEEVTTAPKLKFIIEEPEKFGRIKSVIVSLYQQFEADYSHQAEFTITARDINNSMAQMKPDTVYDLGQLPPEFKAINFENQEVPGITLKPGLKYKLTLAVVADKSETGMVEFKTK